MAESKRQLAAIMFTDIVGYTTLMGEDSAKALDLVRKSKEIQKPLVEKHHGKWLKEMGDGAMAHFNTALDAVNCAIEIQEAARAKFDTKLRIGIHSGDITIENEDVYGDGVNVAARLESIADPGGIYISDAIQKAIQGQTDTQAKYLGEIRLKNVAYGVRTYALQGVGLPIPNTKKKRGSRLEFKKKDSTPKRILVAVVIVTIVTLFVFRDQVFGPLELGAEKAKTIAVLPFKNLSDDPNTQYFVDGMMDVILTNLARVADLDVTSRTSVEKYREGYPTIKEIAEELNVNYLVEASVQKFGDQIKIVVQLIDANKDSHLWAETYDREWKDVLTLQSDLSLSIAEKLNSRISNSEINLMRSAHDTHPLAQDYLFKAENLQRAGSTELAIQLAEKAIAIDSTYALAWHRIGWSESFLYLNGHSHNNKKIKDAFDRALMLRPDLPDVQDGPARYLYAVEKDYAGAIKLLEELDKKYPNFRYHKTSIARAYRRLGDFEKAEQYYQAAAIMNGSSWFHWNEYGDILTKFKKYNEAEQAYINAISQDPSQFFLYFQRAQLEIILDGDFTRANETTSETFLQQYYRELAVFEILKRNFDTALELEKNVPESRDGPLIIFPKSLRLAMVHYWAGNIPSKTLLQESFDQLQMMDTIHNEEGVKRYEWRAWRIHSGFGMSYAALGNKQKALESVERLKAAYKVNNALGWPIIELRMIQIYIMVKEYDLAIELIKKHLDGPGIVETSITWLKLHPMYDPLRELPEFQAILNDPKYQINSVN